MNDPLSLVCILIVAFAITMYVLLDGFDLGVGILLLTARRHEERDELVESIAPVWDGNETWLILAAIVLFGAFPLAYAILAPAFYLPFMLMLVSLGLRGVGLEFRAHTPFKRFWDHAFCAGSTIAAFCQGLVAGDLLSGGVSTVGGRVVGHTFDVFTGFNCLMGMTAVAGYATLGAAWIRWKTAGRVQRYERSVLRVALLAFLLLTALSAHWPQARPPSPRDGKHIRSRWCCRVWQPSDSGSSRSHPCMVTPTASLLLSVLRQSPCS